jgi:hypothetical protein
MSLWDRLASTPGLLAPGMAMALIGAPIPVITLATQEQFVPQMAISTAWQVNFTKGCYPGQRLSRSQ